MPSKAIFYEHKAENKIRTPITRSSGIFYYKCTEQMDTSIHLLNYWQIKRGITNVEFKITLRDMQGSQRLKTDFPLPERGAFEVAVSAILKKHDLLTSYPEGSIEIEIFSQENLFVAYPAAVVRYKGRGWHTTTHTCQRLFSPTSGDSTDHSIHFAEEGNQTIHSNLELEPFVIIHNGPQDFIDDNAYIEIKGEDGETAKANIATLNWSPFETKILFIRDLIDYRNTLKEGYGTYRIGFHTSGIFPRIIAGFQNDNDNSWSIDHSNFAADTGPVLEDQFRVNPDPTFKNLVFNVPVLRDEQWRCFVDLYPTYPDEDYVVEVSDHALDKHQDIALPSLCEGKVTRLDLSDYDNAQLNFKSKNKLPKRFHTGIYYQYKNSMPTFLIDGPIPHESAALFTRWAPLFGDSENYLFMANRTLGHEPATAINYICQIYNSHADDPIIYEFELAAKASKTMHMESEVPHLREYLQGKPGWIYMKSREPSRTVIHYLSILDDQSLACDHAF